MSSLKNKFRLFSLSLLMILGVVSCTNERVERDDRVQVVEKQIDNSFTDFPFSDKEELKLMNVDNVCDYEMVRRLSTIELGATGFASEMNWLGCRLSECPITIYDLNSRPRYYDFVVYNALGRPVGIVRTYAKRERSTLIEGVYDAVPNYYVYKVGSYPDIFIDWKGKQYVGERSQFGKSPKVLVDMQGKHLTTTDLHDLEGLQIIDHLAQDILPKLVLTTEQKNEVYKNMPQDFFENSEIQSGVSQQEAVIKLKESMNIAWTKTQEEACAFWEVVGANEQAVEGANTFVIKNEPEGLFKRLFGVNEQPYPIKRYDTKKNTYRRDDSYWCGPWACGYIVYINQEDDQYRFFEGRAAMFGELWVGNTLLRIFGRPMTPFEMAWTMPLASDWEIFVNPTLRFRDLTAYEHIKNGRGPALRLCASGEQLHWTLAYGARQTGNRFWRNYYFLQVDNGGKVGVPGDPQKAASYRSVDWWNPWLLVWD